MIYVLYSIGEKKLLLRTVAIKAEYVIIFLGIAEK